MPTAVLKGPLGLPDSFGVRKEEGAEWLPSAGEPEAGEPEAGEELGRVSARGGVQRWLGGAEDQWP